jgi:hypothetical protein
MKQFDFDPKYAMPNNVVYPRTEADAMFGALMRLQAGLDGEPNIVGRARHEPAIAEAAGNTLATTKRTDSDSVAAAAAERVANDPRWRNFSPPEGE